MKNDLKIVNINNVLVFDFVYKNCGMISITLQLDSREFVNFNVINSAKCCFVNE